MSFKILKFVRYPSGALEAMVSMEKTITATKTVGYPARPEGVSAKAHEKAFFEQLKADCEAECAVSQVDVSDVEGKTLDALLGEG